MATVNIRPQGGQFGGAARYGNVTTLRYELSTNASGVPNMANASAALAVNDKVKFSYPLPNGMVVEDVVRVVSDAFDASVTADIGFEYADGVGDATYPQSATAFFTATALSATGRASTASAAALFALPKDAYLTVTIKGANIASAGKLQLIVRGERL